jgi:hypothetical protein
MPLRVLVATMLGLVPLGGHADTGWQAPSALETALGYLRTEKPRRGLEPTRDNLNLWQPSLGVGAQVEVAKNLVLRLDVDRYRPKFPGAMGRDNLDALMLGVQYRIDTD